MKNILIRADSSSKIGTGHIMRDLVLAERLQKKYPSSKIIFATQDLNGNINQKILDAKHSLHILKSNKTKELSTLIQEYQIDLLVIDNYKINYKKEKKIKDKNPALTLMVLDDTYQKHYCDILLNHNVCADKTRYKNLVPKTCQLQCGRKYTLLREEFFKEKKKKQKKTPQLHNVLIAMGGADTANLSIKVLKILKSFPNLHADVVTTQANSHLNKLQKYAKSNKWVKLHINANNIARLMKKSEFAIITPSGIANEALFMDLQIIAIQAVSSNQNEMSNFLKKNNHFVLEKFNKLRLQNILKKVLK